MLDKREIRENPDAVKAAVREKGIDLDVDELLELDKVIRELQHELDQTQARRKSSSNEFRPGGRGQTGRTEDRAPELKPSSGRSASNWLRRRRS